VVGLDDARVDEVGHEPRLADEILLELLDRGVLLTNQLYGDDLLEIARAELVRLVHDAHAALRELTDHLVMNLVENVFNGGHDEPHERAHDAHWQECNRDSARNLLRVIT